MMNLKYLMIALALVGGMLTAVAQNDDAEAAMRERINEAVLKVYDEHLAQDPNDYNTLFARANQYYYNGDFDRAMVDVNTALAITPLKEKELRYEQLVLRARLFDAQQAYEAEITDLSEAAHLLPGSLSATDLLAKACLKTGQLDAAESNFKVILRNQPLNYDAMYGLAQVELKRNNFEAATGHVDKAVSLFTAEPQVYLNRADILEKMNQYEPAALDLISAFSIGDDNTDALSRLVAMADSHYDPVMSALATSIDKAPRAGLFYYIRASIAMDHEHYGQALKNLNSIINNNLYDYHSVYYNAARCQFELMQYDDALNNVNRAIAMLGDEQNADYLLLKARCQLYRGAGKNYDDAMTTLNAVASFNGNHEGTLLQQARILIAQRQDRPAMLYLNAAIDYSEHPSAEAMLLRGWVNKYRNGNEAAARTDFERVAAAADDTPQGLRGFALHEMGRAADARNWAKAITEQGTTAGGANYALAAALLSDMGDNEVAMQYFKNALAYGYGSLFKVKADEEPYVNLKLVRRITGFDEVVNQSQSNFQERP